MSHRFSFPRRAVRVAQALALLAAMPLAQAATLHVTNVNDTGPGSLRAVVGAAADGDVVVFDQAGFLTLVSLIDINHNITIDGLSGGAWVQINGSGATSLFRVGIGHSATLTHLSLINAQNAVQNNGNLTLNQVLARGNTGSMGAAVTGCINPATQVLNVIDSYFLENTATYGGGAVAACGTINISGSTFSANRAYYGGALAVTNTGAVSVVNSTFQGNVAAGPGSIGGFGGGITTDYPGLSLMNVTFSGNSSPMGSALSVADGVAATVNNTLFASGSGGRHCTNPIATGANNLNFGDPAVGGHSCGPSVSISADPLLGTLGNNGGPTPTLALGAGSPAIDAGAGGPATDQRGVARPQGAGVDIGAYERTAAPVVPGTGGVTAVPTLDEWGLAGLAALLGFLALRRMRPDGTGALQNACNHAERKS